MVLSPIGHVNVSRWVSLDEKDSKIPFLTYFYFKKEITCLNLLLLPIIGSLLQMAYMYYKIGRNGARRDEISSKLPEMTCTFSQTELMILVPDRWN